MFSWGAWAQSTFPTFTAFLPRSKGHLSQPSPADTQLSKGYSMWSGQSLLTKLCPHWETSFACLNNFPVKNVFPPSIPALLSSFKTRSSAVGTKFVSKVSRLFGSRCHHFHWTVWWGKITARSDLDFLHLQKVSLSQGFSFQRKIPFLKQTHIFWINCKQKKNDVKNIRFFWRNHSQN